MKLAFNGLAHYPDYTGAYDLYKKRCIVDKPVESKVFSNIIRRYCQLLSLHLEECGIVDLPCRLGSVAAATITRKPQYRGNQFVGYGKMDWTTGKYDGNLKAFGLVYLPNRKRSENLRCYGFVANRRLFKKIKENYENGTCKWLPVTFEDEMI